MSAFPQDMLLYRDGQPRFMNVDNRIRGQINGVDYEVELKGDFAICGFIDPRVQPGAPGRLKRMIQPHFNVLGVMVGAIEVAEGRDFDASVMGLRPPRRDGD